MVFELGFFEFKFKDLLLLVLLTPRQLGGSLSDHPWWSFCDEALEACIWSLKPPYESDKRVFTSGE